MDDSYYNITVTTENTGKEVTLKRLLGFERVVACWEITGGCYFARIQCKTGHKRAFVFDKNGNNWGWMEISNDEAEFTDFPGGMLTTTEAKMLLSKVFCVYGED